MRFSFVFAAAVSALSLAAATASAEETVTTPEAAAAPVSVKNGEWIYSSDGSAIGRIDHVKKNKDGASAAAVIYQMRMVSIPLDSLSAGQKGYVTKLTRSEVSRLK